MKVLGVSGSPRSDSNTDRALKVALDATGLETEFVKLKDYDIEPCRACLGCVETNTCVVNDGGNVLAEKAKQADALIVAGFTPYSSLDGRTKAFIERLYPLRHNHGFMRGKPGGIIMTCAVPEGIEMLPPACENGINAVAYYMMEEGMNLIGSVNVLGNVPCIRCGHGDECDMSAIKMLYGPDATVESAGVNTFEDQPDAVQSAKEMGEAIAKELKNK
ncbi:multimeric flavodoxin WrbA [Methanohalophilus levihalophilus]|uniref:flavodoxin family protein n=1 Tax=Methanohalophilus levihalophilus TaxID=1431282 RepID=UPI001AE1BF32|nr:flavodoxin family protein [Methanohalophilus levihalophilus]MBP2029643.1 multimeric flavodoxin WrbA [Methanohalophilus levihalophilus]